jgi:spoIIIJ-associated protein
MTMEWVETTGRTIDEAKDAALDQLGVDENDAEFVVVTEPRAGLFGRMRGEARVRARVRPTSPRPKRTRARRGRERRGGEGVRGSGPERGSGQPRRGSVAVADDTSTSVTDDVGAAASNGAAGRATRSRRSRSRGRGTAAPGHGNDTERGDEGPEARPTDAPKQARRSRSDRSTESGKEEIVGETLSLEEQGETAREFVAGVVQELGLPATVSSRVIDDDTAEVSVEGQELGVLIGPGGATLGALQELARTFVQKQTGGHSRRIVVDVAGYRAKRVAALQRFTRQVAEEVRTTGTEQALEPMSASDRKVVHDTVNEMEGLGTRSEGDEPRRFIVISPRSSEAPASEPQEDSDA